MASKVRIGVIGCGHISRFAHLSSYQRHPDVELVAVCDAVEERARAAAQTYGAPRWYTDYHELLEREDVQGVSVVTPPGFHAPAAIAAARAGKHVLCEKPLATTTAEAEAMVRAAREAGTYLTTGYQPRFAQTWPTLKRLIDEGWLGEVRGITQTGGGPGPGYSPWFFKRELAGGGCLLDGAIYTAYLFQYLLGRVSKVYAVGRTFVKQRFVQSTPGAGDRLEVNDIDVEDAAAVTLEFASGAIGVIFASWATKAAHGSLEIEGSEGGISSGGVGGLRLFSTKLAGPVGLGGWLQLNLREVELREQHYLKVSDFVEAIRDGRPPTIPAEAGRDAVEVIDAAYRSMRAGAPVSLPLL